MSVGVSVVICCYNSAKRLTQTLNHLVTQEVCQGLQWEVLIIDNASTDDTSQVALKYWLGDVSVPLRVVYESQLGLAYARQRGFKEAKYDIVSFIDDDNWICSKWVQLVSEIMNQQPNIGACGGFSEAVCEITPPNWFECYKGSYAVGPQGKVAGDITWTRGYLWGAGLTIRKSAWQQLVNGGFRHLLTGRQGSKFTAGEDSELCFALRLAGWRLWYEPRLQLKHFLPVCRLDWDYLRSIHRGFGSSTVGHDPYLFALKKKPAQNFFKKLKSRIKETWQWQTLEVVKTLLYIYLELFLLFRHLPEGNPKVLKIERQIGRLTELLRIRNTYNLNIHEVQGTMEIYSVVFDRHTL